VNKGEKRSYFRRLSSGCPYQYHTNTAPSPTALTAAATRPNRTSVIKKMAPIIARARKANPPSYGREPLREGHDKQEGEEHLHPWESHPQLVEQFDDLAVAALLFVFTVPLLLLFTAHLSNILRHRCSLHPFEGLRWAVSERGYPSAPIRAVLCRILDMNVVEFPFYDVG
jgi:hypothetical protein